MVEAEALTAFLADLRRQVVGELRTDRLSRALYSTDASIYRVMPHGVLIPRNLEDVQAAVALAAHYQAPLLPRASGSSLAGQAVNAALVIDVTRHLDAILEINAAERWVRAQPGVTLDALNQAVRPYGLRFGPDPASSERATVGGVVSNNATGAHSIRYGMTADHVLGMEVILSDGNRALFRPKTPTELQAYYSQTGLEAHLYQQIAALVYSPANQAIIRAGVPRHWRRCGGYNLDRFITGPTFLRPRVPGFNLADLLCGAEGTLGFISEVTLNLEPLPRHTALALLHFERLYDALAAVPSLLETEPSAIELLDPMSIQLCRDVPAYARRLKTFLADERATCLLIIEFEAETPDAAIASLTRLEQHVRRHGPPLLTMTTARTPEAQADVWQVRKAALGLLMSLKGDFKPLAFIEDAAVPVEHLADYVTQVEAFCRELGTPVTYYAHASAGCLHIRPLVNAKLAAERDKLPQIARFAAELVAGYGGAISSEHGDGRSRSWLNAMFYGPELYGLFQAVKNIFDPHNLFNPGNIVNAPPMTAHLRYGPTYEARGPVTQLDFSAEQGFDRAIELCNGAGVCRKLNSGVMCPSFQATRAEEHSTRGRANALRAAISGVLPAEALTGPELYGVMDLCLSCKACKAECPSSVDMARLKTEFLAQYYAKHGTPWRARLFGHIHTLSRLGSGPLAPVANWLLRRNLTHQALARWGGLSAQRHLPALARQPLTHWFARHDRARAPNTGTRLVVLLADTFTNYHYPQVGRAAVEALEGLGCQVQLAGNLCCGRPALSKGLVDLARRQARHTLDRLSPLAAAQLPIVGLEPSCVSAIRDDYAALVADDARVALVAAHTQTFEEFMLGLIQAGLEPPPPAGRPALLHTHCHQKALVGGQPGLTLLRWLGYAAQEVDSGCCGMAGSFGYEQKHYALSLSLANLRLAPAVRQASPETVIVASGVSCRQQIEHVTGRSAWHAAEVTCRVLATPGR